MRGGDDNATGNEGEQLEFGPSLTLAPHLSSSLPPPSSPLFFFHLSLFLHSSPTLPVSLPCIAFLPSHPPFLIPLLLDTLLPILLLPLCSLFVSLSSSSSLSPSSVTKQQLLTSSSSVSVHCGAWSSCWPTHARERRAGQAINTGRPPPLAGANFSPPSNVGGRPWPSRTRRSLAPHTPCSRGRAPPSAHSPTDRSRAPCHLVAARPLARRVAHVTRVRDARLGVFIGSNTSVGLPGQQLRRPSPVRWD